MTAPIGKAAANEVVEVTHKGVVLLGVPSDPSMKYDVGVIPPDDAVEKIRLALDRLLEVSPYSASVLNRLKKNGRVVIMYNPVFPQKDANFAGVTLAAFAPDLFVNTPDPDGRIDYPVIVGRYIVKWSTEDLTITLAHELLGHGMQHLRGRIKAMSLLDSECDAGLYEELLRQELGSDKRARISVIARQDLEWRWCEPFKRYMKKHRPDKLALWSNIDPDVRQLLGIFEDYLRSQGIH